MKAVVVRVQGGAASEAWRAQEWAVSVVGKASTALDGGKCTGKRWNVSGSAASAPEHHGISKVWLVPDFLGIHPHQPLQANGITALSGTRASRHAIQRQHKSVRKHAPSSDQSAHHHFPDAFQQAVEVELLVAGDGNRIWTPRNLLHLLHGAHIDLVVHIQACAAAGEAKQ